MNANPRHREILFDEALVLSVVINHRMSPRSGLDRRARNGLHPTTSSQDPDPIPYVTVRLSNAPLRQLDQWYILYWRLNGGSYVFERTDNETANANRRLRRKQKKQRRRERRQGDKRVGGQRGGRGSRGGASGTLLRVQFAYLLLYIA